MEKHRKWLGRIGWLSALILAVAVILLSAGLIRQQRAYDALEQKYRMLDQTYSTEYLHLNSITLDRFYEKMEAGEDMIVCISRPDCGTCREYEAELLAIYDRLGITEEIYYLNVAELHTDDTAWAAFKNSFEIGGTPSFVHVRDGALVSSAGWTEYEGISMEEMEQWLQEQGE